MFGYQDEDHGDDEKTLSVIKELMEQLVGEMEPSHEDFEERLGRKKPGIEILKVEGKMPMDPDKKERLMAEEGEEMGMEPSMDEGEMSPEESLKRRLMKLRA